MAYGIDPTLKTYPTRGPGPGLAAGIVALVVILAVGDPAVPLLAEGGVVETATVAALAFAAAFAVLSGAGWSGLMIALLAMRELDWDKAFLHDGILKARLYTGDAPLVDKAIGAGIVLLSLLTLWILCRGGWRVFLTGLRQGRAWAWAIALGAALVAVAKTLDGLGRKLAGFGVDISAQLDASASGTEEILELAFAICLCVAVLTYRR